MPIEYVLLNDKPLPFDRCPNPQCFAKPFYPFMRGEVHIWWRKLLGRPHSAIICSICQTTVGYE